MKKWICILLFLAVLLLLNGITASADSWIPVEAFEVVSADGGRVFRFDPGKEHWDEASLAAAGVYSNTQPPQLLYTVEGLRAWAYENQFYFSEDLTHFAFVPSPTMDTAVEFYHNGSLTRRYGIHALVRRKSMIRQSVSSLWWLEEADPNVISDPEANTLTVKTIDGQTHTFDLLTGELLQTEKENFIQITGRWLKAKVLYWVLWYLEELWFWLVGAIAVVCIVIVIVRKRKNKNK